MNNEDKEKKKKGGEKHTSLAWTILKEVLSLWSYYDIVEAKHAFLRRCWSV